MLINVENPKYHLITKLTFYRKNPPFPSKQLYCTLVSKPSTIQHKCKWTSQLIFKNERRKCKKTSFYIFIDSFKAFKHKKYPASKKKNYNKNLQKNNYHWTMRWYGSRDRFLMDYTVNETILIIRFTAFLKPVALNSTNKLILLYHKRITD